MTDENLLVSIVHSLTVNVYGIAIDDHGILYYTCGVYGLWSLDPKNPVPKDLSQDYFPFCEMKGIVYDRKDSLYICTAENGILKYDLKQKKFTAILGIYGIITGDSIKFAHGIAIDMNGDLYVTDVSRVFKIDMKTRTIQAISPSIREPQGITVANNGNIYVCVCSASWSGLTGCVRQVIDYKAPIVYQDGTLKMCSPDGILEDKNGDLLVASQTCLCRINTKTWKMTEIKQIKSPICLTMDRKGNIFVYEAATGNILRIHNSWAVERLLWIGNLKEDASYCCLARVPKDIIREILKHLPW